jgi:hypothetical protein
MQTTSVSLLDRLANAADNEDWQKLLLIYRPFIFQVVSGYPSRKKKERNWFDVDLAGQSCFP